MTRIRDRLQPLFTTELFRYDELKKMFFTLALDQFFIYAIGILSSAMVSSVGEEAIAAVSMVNTVNSLVCLLFTSLASGGAIVVARAKGAGENDTVRRAIGQVSGLCGIVSIAVCLILLLGAEPIVRLLYPQVEPLLIEYSVDYMRLMALSFVPFSVFNAIFNIYRNLGDTRPALMLTIVINVAHLVFSLLLINILGLGVKGSGYAYIAARVLGFAIAMIWILYVHNDCRVRLIDFFRFSGSVTREVVSFGAPLTVESILTQGGMLLVQIYLALLTTTDLAAHAVANSILNLYYTTASAIGALTGTVCGRCCGAKRYDLAAHYNRALTRVGRLIMFVTSLILYPMTPLLMLLYHESAEGASIVYLALAVGAAGLALFWSDASIPATTLRVAGDSVFIGVISVLSLLIGRCALGYFLTISCGLGVLGVWIALIFEWILRAVLLRLRLRRDQRFRLKAQGEYH